jgi:uroporphyrinogen-III synthase
MPVVVTRPEPECTQWVQSLAGRGMQALALPLISIGPVRDATAVRRCWYQLDRFQAVMVVSGAAATHFFALRPPDAPIALATRFWAPGPGTVAALLRLGVAPERVDSPDATSGQFDSEALWRVVGPQVRPGWNVLIVRGGDDGGAEPLSDRVASEGNGRDWLARTLAVAGAHVEFVMAYERTGPTWSEDQRARALAAASDGSVWLLTSSQALEHLVAQLPGQGWQQATAVATHPRIAQAARDAGFGVVWESRPRLEDVVASIESRA